MSNNWWTRRNDSLPFLPSADITPILEEADAWRYLREWAAMHEIDVDAIPPEQLIFQRLSRRPSAASEMISVGLKLDLWPEDADSWSVDGPADNTTGPDGDVREFDRTVVHNFPSHFQQPTPSVVRYVRDQEVEYSRDENIVYVNQSCLFSSDDARIAALLLPGASWIQVHYLGVCNNVGVASVRRFQGIPKVVSEYNRKILTEDKRQLSIEY